MAHRNARLTHFGRLLLVQRITELGWPPAQAAESLGVSRATAYKWLGRYRAQGRAGLANHAERRAVHHAVKARQVTGPPRFRRMDRRGGGLQPDRPGQRGGLGGIDVTEADSLRAKLR